MFRGPGSMNSNFTDEETDSEKIKHFAKTSLKEKKKPRPSLYFYLSGTLLDSWCKRQNLRASDLFQVVQVSQDGKTSIFFRSKFKGESSIPFLLSKGIHVSCTLSHKCTFRPESQ